MTRVLRILHLEDNPDYPDLIKSMLDREGIGAEFAVAQNGQEFEELLETVKFDLILADYLVPGYDGLRALRRALEVQPGTPFLLVSGTMGEQAAIESLKAGATDYVLKQWPERLVPAIKRALHEAEERLRRQEIEAQLTNREKYFRALTENSLDVVTILDGEGAFMYNSPSVTQVLGYAPEALNGQNAFELVHPEDRSRAQEAFDNGLVNGLTVRLEFRYRHADGSWRHLEAVGQNRLHDPDIGGVVVNSRDITDRKNAEQALRDSEQRFRDLFEGSPDAIFVEDMAGTVLDVNPAACALHGLPRGELIGCNLSRLVPPDARERVMSDFQALVDNQISRIEGASWTGDGRAVPVEVRANRIEYAGQPAMLLHVRDITERKHAEAALRSSEMLFHSVWENSVDGMRLTDEQGRIVAVNDAYCKLVGLPRERLEGELLTVLFAPSEDFTTILRNYSERFQNRVAEKQAERTVKLSNGKLVTFEVSSSFVERAGEQPLLLGLFRDVTLQKGLQEQLRQAQKMEAIGQLAGGVAHDFNNLLTVIHGHASLLSSGGLAPGPAARSAEQIVQAAERAAGLTRQLLTFSRRQVMQPRSLDLNEVVANMTKMLARILGEDISLQVHYSSQPALVRADAGMLEQVLLNLAVNSRDAMPRGGELALKIGVRELRSHEIEPDSEARPGRFVCLRVTDTGCGIAPENLRRIFEPFFTTKEVGKGTGLGLATVYGIVNQHQGWIAVRSQLHQGSTFEVYLPFSPLSSGAPDESPRPAALRGGSETILVVEDEAPVRELVCSLLAGHGYQILEAESGAKALDLWRQCKDKVDLVLTDLVMPDHVDGRELAERFWAERPKLKVIFTSGYSADVVGKDFVLQRGLNYLQKPYPPDRLAKTVRECLDVLN